MKIKRFNENLEDVQFEHKGISFYDLISEKLSTTKGYVIVSFSADDQYADIFHYPNEEECKKHFNINNGWVAGPKPEIEDEYSVNENECYLFIDGKKANG